jgi:NADPH-dependent 2,4-dienoyl-CoA reductase/sulfur reductase-like enzyme
MTETTHHEVLIIGGGNAGISLAARLHRYGVTDIAVVEPKDHHLYQPLFSHIAGGKAKAAEAIRSQASVTPPGVEWIRDAALVINAAANVVTLDSGEQITYGHLVVCPGLQLDWDKIPGLEAAVRSPYGASHYDFELAPRSLDSAQQPDVRHCRVHHAVRTGQVRRRRPETHVPCLRLLEGTRAPRRHPRGHGPALSHRLWRARRGR